MLVNDLLSTLKRNTYIVVLRKSRTPRKEVLLQKYSDRLSNNERVYIGFLSVESIETHEISEYRRAGLKVYVK